MKITILTAPVKRQEIAAWAQEGYGEMIKAVVDVGKGMLAVGGELHADAEALLLEEGSRQEDLWGINLYPEKGPSDRIEYNSLINIRPRQKLRSMEIQDEKLRGNIRQVVGLWIIWD